MDHFTLDDKEWFIKVQEHPDTYKIIIDNDGIWVEEFDNNECVYTFTSYGYNFVYALLNLMCINAEYC